MDHARAVEVAERLLDAWNSQDVETVVDCYTEDVRYLDPNTRGYVEGREALRSYLTKLFGAWEMHWSLREAFPLRGEDGAAVLWSANLRRAGEEADVEVGGMDLALVAEGDRLSRNEVYFDRARLAALMAAGAASA
jgi:ketosteroid isomerase-like protein